MPSTAAFADLGKDETFVLTKPLRPGLPLDHTALEELHLGTIPCVRVRDGANESLDPALQPGETETFRGKLTLLNLPRGCGRVEDPDWNENMSTAYAKQLTDTAEHADLLFLLYELRAGAAATADTFSTRSADYCEADRAEAGLKYLGKDNPCDVLFRSGSSAFVVSYDYYHHLDYKPELRDLLKTKYFNRDGKGVPGSKSEAPVKMLCTLIPGRGLVWIPVVGPPPANFSDFLKGAVLEAFHLTFLDGPNIYIAKLVDTPW